MRLHRLALSGIGPFPDRHTIDFTRLGTSGLFLLEGPTGAGKSTIIDAIVFALYGRVASAAASEERMRSRFADPSSTPMVDLVLSTGAGVYRIRRTPAFDRPKRSGTGTTRQQASAILWRLPAEPEPDVTDDALDAVGEVVSTRLDEVGLQVRRVVGLDVQQFVQTVVLPQGEFAGFLRARPEERSELLQRVFGTQVYARAQEVLAGMRRDCQHRVDEASRTLRAAVDRLVGAAGLAELTGAIGPGAATEPDDPAGVVEAAAHVIDDLGAVAVAARARSDQAQADAAAARATADEADVVADRVRRHTEALAEQAALDAQAAEQAERSRRLSDAGRATAVAPVLDDVTAAQQEWRVTWDMARALVPVLADPAGPRSVPDPQSLRDLRAGLRAQRDADLSAAARLQRAEQVEVALPATQAEAADARRAVAEATAEHERLTALVAQLPATRAGLVERLDRARFAAGTAAAHRAVVETARQVHGAAVEELRLASEADRLTSEQEQAAVAALEAAHHEHALRAARLAGMAGELAGTLVPGDACPVCGSTSHPAPARPEDGAVTAEQVDAAEAARAAAEDLLAGVRTALATASTRRAAAAETASGLGPQAAADRLAAAEQQLAATELAAADEEAAARALACHDAGAQDIRTRLTDAGAGLAAAAHRLAAGERALADDEQLVAEARAEWDTVAARRTALQGAADRAGQAVDALVRLEGAGEQWSRSAQLLATALAGQGFADADAARAALLGPEVLAELTHEVDTYAEAVRAVRSTVAELADVAALDPATVDAAQAAAASRLAQADAVSGEAVGAAHTATARAEAVREAQTTLLAAAKGLTAAREAAAPVLRMADVAAGDNPRRLTLQTFVLARRFEDVVAAANERLAVMSDGRFELERTEDAEDVRARRVGLALRVLDHRTDSARDPRTLSGGETFYVSLCLALGMADVVTAEAGGTDLGTLFVDEGFGSLDPPTLDLVLAELGRLRSGGRTVGVVSHLDALKQAIAERIEVRRRPDGSSTLTVRA